MHFLSLIPYINAEAQTLAATSTTAAEALPGLSSTVKLIVEAGVLTVIAGIMLIVMWKMLNNIIKRDNKLFEGLSPKMDTMQETLTKNLFELETKINEVSQNISLLISNHNAHTNQTIKALERDQADMRELLIQNQDTLNDISGQLTAMNSSISTLLLFVSQASGKMQGMNPSANPSDTDKK